ncbi:helix-turn-helix domain-containing protein [Roseibium aggregatum]|uniref:Helix-turn-helix transcriptional regulator n=1 Tax=Roseibium aggregatum TaxID=187304 RepID=A0A939J714_9HYPH|nr:AraC family transcriptional regulator [Roseibium aggregatum]MBN9673349.1 helix-turn-helix transcriptional regulator [Roseibium aggregatum]
MLVFPVPLFVAFVLGFLFAQAMIAKNRPVLFSALLLVCALQNLIVALGQYYGLPLALKLQPFLAAGIPPLAWLAFVSASFRPVTPAKDWVHMLGPAFVAFCVLFAPVTLDPVIGLVFLGYGCALLVSLHAHRDALPLARLDAGTIPQRIWTAIALALLVSAMTDMLIAYAFNSGSPDWAHKIISAGSAAALFVIGVLSLSPNVCARDLERASQTSTATEAGQQPPSTADLDLLGRLDDLLTTKRLFLDPDLTLNRFAQKLGVPAKQLSTAINRTTGENISRYINAHRIRHACALLEEGANVTTAMLESGFNTKSNFNREFSRLTGRTPSAWSADAEIASASRPARLSPPPGPNPPPA